MEQVPRSVSPRATECRPTSCPVLITRSAAGGGRARRCLALGYGGGHGARLGAFWCVAGWGGLAQCRCRILGTEVYAVCSGLSAVISSVALQLLAALDLTQCRVQGPCRATLAVSEPPMLCGNFFHMAAMGLRFEWALPWMPPPDRISGCV